jgi:hypothetical protein
MARVLFIMVAFFSLGGGPALSAGAQFKGINALSKELSARIAPEEAPIELDLFMPADGLDQLTGTWSTFGAEHTFQNGQPNAVNMVLLRLAFSRFADSVANSCKTPQLIFNEPFFDTLEALCTWPSGEAQSEDVMVEFWLAMMGYNAPKSEYEAWRDFVRKTYARNKPQEAVSAMTLAIMLNPHFLLQR